MIVLINKEIVFDKISKRFCGIPYFLIELPPNNKVASYYNVCDIFLPPIRSEGFAAYIHEASYMVCNVIASDISSQKEAEGIDKIYFQNENIDDLKKLQQLKDKLSDEEILKRRKYLEKEHGLEEWDRKIIDFYDEL